jgi:hypothetical protein
LLVSKDVAELLGIDRHAIRSLVQSGKLDIVRLPGRTRDYFTREGVERLIKTCTVSGPLSGPPDDPEDAKTGQTPPHPALFKRAAGSRKATPGVRNPLPRGWERKYR